MNKKLLSITILTLLFAGLATAQTATVTSTDTQLTDAQITVEFTGLPQDQQLIVESYGEDTTKVTSFTSTSAGTATVAWRHNPFEDGTALTNDGWGYRVRTESGDFSYDFEVAHGNMLLSLDTFYDNKVNNDLWITEVDGRDDEDCNPGVPEQNRQFRAKVSTDDSVFGQCYATAKLNQTITPNEKAVFNITSARVAGSNDFRASITFLDTDGNVIDRYSVPDIDEGVNKIGFDADGIVVYDGQGQEIKSFSTPERKIRLKLEARVLDNSANDGLTEVKISDFSIVPDVSSFAFKSPTRYDIRNDIILGDYLVEEPENVGLQFSNETGQWSVTLPSQGSELNYRNTGNGTLGAVAVDTSQAFSGLTFNNIRPKNGTTSIIDDGATITQDFKYEILYTPKIQKYRGLLVSWTLYNADTGEKISQSAYPNLEMDETETTFFKEFTQEEELGAGNYRWVVEFTDFELGKSRFFTNTFSLREESDVPVDFNLTSPSDGETVDLQDGLYSFDYSVQTDVEGDLSIKIPQYDDEERFTTSIPTGEYTTETNLALEPETDYQWYLEFVKPSSTEEVVQGYLLEDFEDGDLNNPDWDTSSSGSYSVTNNNPISGSYSLDLADNLDTLTAPFIQNGTSYVQYKLNYNGGLTYNREITFKSDGVYSIGLLKVQPDGELTLYKPDTNSFETIKSGGQGSYTTNVTIRNYDSETGQGELYLDGTQVFSGALSGSQNTPIETLVISATDTADNSGALLFDDLRYGVDRQNITNPSESYRSRIIDFSTGEDTSTGGGDDGDGGGDTGAGINLGQIVFDILNWFGLSDNGAGLVVGTIIVMVLGALGYFFGYIVGGAVGMMMGLIVSGIQGWYPGWTVFVILVIASYILAKIWEEGISD